VFQALGCGIGKECGGGFHRLDRDLIPPKEHGDRAPGGKLEGGGGVVDQVEGFQGIGVRGRDPGLCGGCRRKYGGF
jgi:hypothetical protein